MCRSAIDQQGKAKSPCKKIESSKTVHCFQTVAYSSYFLNWFQCQGQFFDSNRYKITTVTGEKSVSTAWPPY